MSYSEGDQVLAIMPTTQEYEKATVLNAKGSKFKVRFRGGVEHTVSLDDIKAPRTSRSQTRTRGRPAGKSPARKSPGRKSPSRGSPARSPNAQARKLPVRSSRQAKVSIARLEMPKDNSSDTDRTEESENLHDDFIEPPSLRSRDIGPATRRSIRIMSNASKAEQEHKLMMLTRSIDRAVSLPVERKALDNVSDGKERGLSVQRDEDMLKMLHYEENTDGEPEIGEKAKFNIVSKPQEWGGWFGAWLCILALPVGTILLQISCTNNHCSQKNFRIPHYKEWRSFLSLEAFLLCGGFLTFVTAISALPIGKLVDGQQSRTGRLQYRLNGIITLILSTIVFGVCTYLGYNISDFLLKKSLQISVAGLAYGIILALALYIKGGRVPVSNQNIYGSTNNFAYDFWQGREVNPRIGPVDVKFVLLRFSLIAPMIINLAAIVKIIKSTESLDINNPNFATILLASVQIGYMLHSIILESSLLTSFEIEHEGTGYMTIVGCLIYPHLATFTTRYSLIRKAQQPIYILCIPLALFFVGYFIYKQSNSEKNQLRKNPFAPSVSHLETIPTKRGKRLLVSGWWGRVRHPNYFADILIHISFAAFCFTIDFLAYYLLIEITVLLVYRAIRDDARCAKRYGPAWEQYRSRVKHMILKWVF